MDIKASYLTITGGVEAMRADALLGILKERGRGFASNSETWAELRLALDVLKKQTGDIEKVHKEMWEAVKDRNLDAFSALCQEFERSAAALCGDWVRASVLAKIALEDPELPEEPTREEKIRADRSRLNAISAKLFDLEAVLPMAKGEIREDLAREKAKLDCEALEIEARLAAAGEPTAAQDEDEGCASCQRAEECGACGEGYTIPCPVGTWAPGGSDDENAERSTYYEYKGDMTLEEYDAFRKKVDEDRARLQEIRETRMDIAERLPLANPAVAKKLRRQDWALEKEEADIIAALSDAGVVVDMENLSAEGSGADAAPQEE